MTLGLAVIAPYGDGLITSAGFLRDFAGTIEECGVDSVWTVEHVIVADAYDPKYPYSSDGRMPTMSGVVPMPDPLELLAFFGADDAAAIRNCRRDRAAAQPCGTGQAGGDA